MDRALHYASREGKAECVRLLLGACGGVDARNNLGQTSLMLACEGCDVGLRVSSRDRDALKCVDALVSAGADVNAVDETGWTPLHYAARNGMGDVAERVLVAGARINAETAKGHTAFDWAMEEGAGAVRALERAGGRRGRAKGTSCWDTYCNPDEDGGINTFKEWIDTEMASLREAAAGDDDELETLVDNAGPGGTPMRRGALGEVRVGGSGRMVDEEEVQVTSVTSGLGTSGRGPGWKRAP